eukprot:1749988-Pleurochrysis_carterae.AAC.5
MREITLKYNNLNAKLKNFLQDRELEVSIIPDSDPLAAFSRHRRGAARRRRLVAEAAPESEQTRRRARGYTRGAASGRRASRSPATSSRARTSLILLVARHSRLGRRQIWRELSRGWIRPAWWLRAWGSSSGRLAAAVEMKDCNPAGCQL